jgi:ATP-dependent Clp protease, protease subunit
MIKAAAILMAVTAGLLSAGFAPVDGGRAVPPLAPPEGRVFVTGGPEGAHVRVEGVIGRTVERQLAGVFAAQPPGRPVMIELDSPGGYVASGQAIIDRILAERRGGRPVATRVRAGESCESMCVGLFLAGYPRQAAPSAEFMVHAPRIHESGRIPLRAAKTMMSRLESLGASRGWLERVRATGGFSGARDHRELARDLVAENANVVTDLIR